MQEPIAVLGCCSHGNDVVDVDDEKNNGDENGNDNDVELICWQEVLDDNEEVVMMTFNTAQQESFSVRISRKRKVKYTGTTLSKCYDICNSDNNSFM